MKAIDKLVKRYLEKKGYVAISEDYVNYSMSVIHQARNEMYFYGSDEEVRLYMVGNLAKAEDVLLHERLE